MGVPAVIVPVLGLQTRVEEAVGRLLVIERSRYASAKVAKGEESAAFEMRSDTAIRRKAVPAETPTLWLRCASLAIDAIRNNVEKKRKDWVEGERKFTPLVPDATRKI